MVFDKVYKWPRAELSAMHGGKDLKQKCPYMPPHKCFHQFNAVFEKNMALHINGFLVPKMQLIYLCIACCTYNKYTVKWNTYYHFFMGRGCVCLF